MFRRRLSWRMALGLLLLAWVAGKAPRIWGRPRLKPATSVARTSAPPTTAAPRASAARTSAPRASVGSEPSPGARSSDPFASAASCAALVSAGGRLARPAEQARFASWNLHWFPDGQPGEREAGADLEWLSCVLGWLDADVIAVQEIKQSAHAAEALAGVLEQLNRATGAHYVARLDACGRRVPQHVGLIWNEARVTAHDVEMVAALNPTGEACQGELRPGLAARFRFSGGLDLEVISAHFKSMADQRGFDLRGRSFAALPGVLADFTQKTHDPDLLLLGDLNTMGCEECSPPVAALEEVARAQTQLERAGLRLVPADAPGTELSPGHFTLLDHAVASASMRELSPTAKSHVAGFCGATNVAPSGRAAKQLRRALSDHCPIVLDLSDRDTD